MAEAYRVKQIGKVCEFSMDEISNKSIEELIDQGRRFIIVNKQEDGYEEETDED